jgi:hypothetical protein
MDNPLWILIGDYFFVLQIIVFFIIFTRLSACFSLCNCQKSDYYLEGYRKLYIQAIINKKVVRYLLIVHIDF